MDFRDAERRYEALAGQWRAKQLTREEFQRQVSALRLQDTGGNWWQIRAPDGAWLRWNGSAWEVATLPAHAPEVDSSAPAKSGRMWLLAAVPVALCLCVFLVGGAALAITRPWTPAGPQLADVEFVRGMLDDPPYFDIIMPLGEQPRQEKWYYPEHGVSFSFVDGQFAGSDDMEPWPPAEMAAITPVQFHPGMAAAEVTALVGEEPLSSEAAPLGIEAETTIVLYAGVLAGFQDGGLIYLESAPFVRSDSGQTPASTLTTVGVRDESRSRMAAQLRLDAIRAPMVAAQPVGRLLADEEFDPLASPYQAGVLSTGWKILTKVWKVRSTAQAGGKAADLSDILAEVTGSIAELREMDVLWRQEAAGLAGEDPFRAGQLNAAAGQAVKLADALESQLLPKLQGESTWQSFKEAVSFFLPRSLATSPPAAEGIPGKSRSWWTSTCPTRPGEMDSYGNR